MQLSGTGTQFGYSDYLNNFTDAFKFGNGNSTLGMNSQNGFGNAIAPLLSVNPATSGLGTGTTVVNLPKETNPYDTGFFGSNAFGNVLSGAGIGLNAINGFLGYKMGKEYLNQARENLAFEKSKFNETYNNALKQYNTSLADRLRARAAFETGNSNAYNDEIAANSMQRGQTGQAGSDYLNYKRSANA